MTEKTSKKLKNPICKECKNRMVSIYIYKKMFGSTKGKWVKIGYVCRNCNSVIINKDNIEIPQDLGDTK
jgi:tRNA(Ile2) C34 agmatinyltransferase TiaS